MSEGGKDYAATEETADAVGMYEHLRTLIPAIRAARTPLADRPCR